MNQTKFLLLIILLLTPITTLAIYYLFFVNFGLPLFPSFPKGNETIRIRGLGPTLAWDKNAGQNNL